MNFNRTPNKNVGPNALQIAGKIDAWFFVFCDVIVTLADVLDFLYDALPVNAFLLKKQIKFVKLKYFDAF